TDTPRKYTTLATAMCRVPARCRATHHAHHTQADARTGCGGAVSASVSCAWIRAPPSPNIGLCGGRAPRPFGGGHLAAGGCTGGTAVARATYLALRPALCDLASLAARHHGAGGSPTPCSRAASPSFGRAYRCRPRHHCVSTCCATPHVR